MIAKTTDELPKLGEADESGANPSAPPSKSLDVAPTSKQDEEPRGHSEPVAAVARPAWMTSRYAIVALLLALATLFVAMRMLRH